MKSKAAPHEKLTDEEIKELVRDLSTELHEIRDHFMEQMEIVESYIYKLERHFNPERFALVEVDGNDLNDLLMSTYGNMNLGEPMIFKKPEATDGVEEAE